MDKHTNHAGHFLQDMVGAAPDQDAGAFLCQLADNLGLVGEQVIVFCEAGAFRGEQLIAVISARQQGAQAVYFFFILEQGGIDAAVFGGH